MGEASHVKGGESWSRLRPCDQRVRRVPAPYPSSHLGGIGLDLVVPTLAVTQERELSRPDTGASFPEQRSHVAPDSSRESTHRVERDVLWAGFDQREVGASGPNCRASSAGRFGFQYDIPRGHEDAGGREHTYRWVGVCLSELGGAGGSVGETRISGGSARLHGLFAILSSSNWKPRRCSGTRSKTAGGLFDPAGFRSILLGCPRDLFR